MSPATLRADELAERLGISAWLVYDMVRQGTCPVPVIRCGRRVLFAKAAVDALLGREAET